MIDEEVKAFILLRSHLDEGYETFVLTLINGRTSFSYKEVTTALVNLELRKKDKKPPVAHQQRYWPWEEVIQNREEEAGLHQ